MIELKQIENIWVLTLQAPKANILGEAMLSALDERLAQVEAEPGLGLVIASQHSDFALGADVPAFTAWFSDSRETLVARLLATHDLFNRIESLPVPSVAFVKGFALGGGLELALAAQYLVVDETAQLGLPETTLGLCPGWGGSVRTRRRMGPSRAFALASSGRPIRAAQAVEQGLADAEIADFNSLLAWVGQQAVRPPALAALDDGVFSPTGPRQSDAAVARLFTEQSGMTSAAALRFEVEVFAELAQTEEAAGRVQAFLNDRAVVRHARAQAEGARAFKSIGVLGAGIMGGGIAWQAASKGFAVVVKDITQAALDQARGEVDRLTRGAQKKGRLATDQAERLLGRLAYTLDDAPLADCELIVEAVTERLTVKHAVLQQAGEASPKAMLASNTSTIRIDRLAEALPRPAEFAGLHFFNPVPVMPLVEVIQGQHTSAESVASLVRLASELGKKPVVVKDCPGFLVNRVLFPYLVAFERLVAEGQSVEHIDQVMQDFGWPMGPGLLSDVIGLDTCVHAGDVMAAAFERMAPPSPSPLRSLVAAGHLGQKTGQGYYVFERSEYGRLEAQRPSLAGDAEPLAPETVIQTLMTPMVEELARCVREGVVASAELADAACLMGLGFPAYRGGPLFWAQRQGVELALA